MNVFGPEVPRNRSAELIKTGLNTEYRQLVDAHMYVSAIR